MGDKHNCPRCLQLIAGNDANVICDDCAERDGDMISLLPNNNGHTEACTDFQSKMRYERVVYHLTWPKYCRNCDGLGEIVYNDDPSASGVGLSPGSMEFSDPCQCLEHGNCLRCGRYNAEWLNAEDDMLKCPVCGWVYQSSPGCPPGWDGECNCIDDMLMELP